MLKAFFAKFITRNATPAAPIAPKSRKHIRVTYRTFDASIAYYGENGRKVTRRNNVSFSALPALINAARANGYVKA